MPTGDGSLAVIIGILSALVLVLANGFFVACEFSLVAVRRSRVAQLVAADRMNAAALQRATENLDINLASCQLGITISSLALRARSRSPASAISATRSPISSGEWTISFSPAGLKPTR
jgi:CBS domain containing-hemolysin-like protein